jgi:hypothetical protein
MTRIIPTSWMPKADIVRVIGHWTAGGYAPSEGDRSHYHLIIDGEAKLVRGIPTISANGLPKVRAGYAAHTLNCNTGSVGISIAAMALAQERPFRAGKAPIKLAQWATFVLACADLCEAYGIVPTPKTLLTHAEVQANLGIKQRGKWDIAVLPFDLSRNTAKLVGDSLRADVKRLLGPRLNG